MAVWKKTTWTYKTNSNQWDKHTREFNRSAASGKVVSGSGRIWPHSCHLEANDKGDENKRRSSFTKWKVNLELYFFGFWNSELIKRWHEPNKHPDPRHTQTSRGNDLVLCLLPSEIIWSLSCSSTICGFCWNTNLTTFLNMRTPLHTLNYMVTKTCHFQSLQPFSALLCHHWMVPEYLWPQCQKPGAFGQHGHMTNPHFLPPAPAFCHLNRCVLWDWRHLSFQLSVGPIASGRSRGLAIFFKTKNILQGVAYEVACKSPPWQWPWGTTYEQEWQGKPANISVREVVCRTLLSRMVSAQTRGAK